MAVNVNTPGCLTRTTAAVTVRDMNLGQRVIAARDHAGFTQAQLATRIGMSQQSVAKLEAGGAKRTSRLAEICLETGVSLRWLARGEGTMLESQPARPDLVILDRAVTVLKNLARMQAGNTSFLYDARRILALYDALSREPPDIDLDREAVLGRMAAVLRGVNDDEAMGRGDAVGAG